MIIKKKNNNNNNLKVYEKVCYVMKFEIRIKDIPRNYKNRKKN